MVWDSCYWMLIIFITLQVVYNDGDFEDLSVQEVVELAYVASIAQDIKLDCKNHANKLKQEGKISFANGIMFV